MPPAVTRVVFTEADRHARAYVSSLCTAVGFGVRADAVGNTFARLVGSDPDATGIATGSHIDAVPNAGMYDGTVGVLGGLEAMRALVRAGWRPRRSIDLLLFTSEEPTRFGIGCLGSRLLSGALDHSAGTRLKGADGLTLDEARAQAGFSGPLSSVRLGTGHYTAFVELHIEQGPMLERRVWTLASSRRSRRRRGCGSVVDGEGGHAGAVLMPDRRDAFLAAAEIALAVEAAARSSGAVDTVGTVGVCDLFPGAVNSVPSRARLEVDVRDIDLERRDAVLAQIADACDVIADAPAREPSHAKSINADPPALCAPQIVEALITAADARGLTHQPMISRAYHDSLFMSRIVPTAMIFIPCRGGVSHRPDEYASPEAIAKGVEVLAGALAALSI